MQIGFNKVGLEKSLDDMNLADKKAFLVYVHQNDHKLTPHVMKEILQDPTIAAIIVNWLSDG